MSAQSPTPGAPPPPAVRAEQTDDEAEPGEAALDRWLRYEFGRLYDAALAEPVPDELARLLDAPCGTRRSAGPLPAQG